MIIPDPSFEIVNFSAGVSRGRPAWIRGSEKLLGTGLAHTMVQSVGVYVGERLRMEAFVAFEGIREVFDTSVTNTHEVYEIHSSIDPAARTF